MKGLEDDRSTYGRVSGDPDDLRYDYELSLNSLSRNWLGQYNLTDQEIRDYKFGMKDGRLIIPIYRDDQLVYYQARALNGEQPKYCNPTVKSTWFESLPSDMIDQDTVVIVEDIISAIKVGRVCKGIAILGSFVSVDVTASIRDYERVFLWLDYDKAKESYITCLKLSSELGKRVLPIITELDPKEYSTQEIRKFIYDTKTL